MDTKTPRLFKLPAEIRQKIWAFAFCNLDVYSTTFGPPLGKRDGGSNRTCFACPEERPAVKGFDDAYRPLLTCKQIYAEANPIFQRTLCRWVSTPRELGHMRRQLLLPCSRPSLRHLVLRIHLVEDEYSRENWFEQLTNLHESFPSLQQLHVIAHIRPPVAYENLADAIFLIGPLSSLPNSIELTRDFNYTEDDVMFTRPEFGIVYYHDALLEHRAVIDDILVDEMFKRFARVCNLDLMTARLLEISRAHEEPWIRSLRAKRLEEERLEAMANRRMNGNLP